MITLREVSHVWRNYINWIDVMIVLASHFADNCEVGNGITIDVYVLRYREEYVFLYCTCDLTAQRVWEIGTWS